MRITLYMSNTFYMDNTSYMGATLYTIQGISFIVVIPYTNCIHCLFYILFFSIKQALTARYSLSTLASLSLYSIIYIIY